MPVRKIEDENGFKSLTIYDLDDKGIDYQLHHKENFFKIFKNGLFTARYFHRLSITKVNNSKEIVPNGVKGLALWLKS